MKNLLKIFFVVLMVVAFGGCNKKYSDNFPESSSKRMDDALSNYKTILSGASCGWIIEYYPSPSRLYGGYNIWVKFSSDGNVEAMSEAYGTATVVKSQYTLHQNAGAVLSFDTYNKAIHYYSDPKNADGIGAAGTGMEGDFEFTILKATADSVILYGKKTQNRIRMIPLDCATTKEAYFKAVSDMSLKYAAASKYIINTDTANASLSSYRSLTIAYKENGNALTLNAPFIVTPKGIIFYSAITIFGKSVTEMIYDSANDMFVDATSGAKLIPVVLPLNQQLINGKWYMALSGLSSYGVGYWTTVTNSPKTRLAIIGERLYYIYLSQYTGAVPTTMRLTFSSYNGTTYYTGYYVMSFSLTGDDKIKMTLTSYDSNGQWYYSTTSGGGFSNLIYPLARTGGKNFTLTSDNIKNPNWIKLTDDAIPTNSVTLYKKIIYWPFDN